MVQVNYIADTDELELIFTKIVETPDVVKLDNGIIFEFDTDNLSAIILPNFGQMTRITGLENLSIEFEEALLLLVLTISITSGIYIIIETKSGFFSDSSNIVFILLTK